jgi:hypothetical protein
MKQILFENWEELTEEQQSIALKQIEANPQIKPKEPHPASVFFDTFKWVKIEKFIDESMAALLYQHVKLEVQRLAYLENSLGHQFTENPVLKEHFGQFGDGQAPGDFSKYGDPIFDALLLSSLLNVEEYINLKLLPNYSYHRLYTSGAELKKHIDRPSCEISITLCLGYDVSNVDKNKYPDYNWPMFVKDTNGNELPIHMKPGDALIYRGCEIEHWRESFFGLNHAQVFFHYNEKDGKYNIAFDGRPVLGLPATFRSQTPWDITEGNAL